MELCEGQGKGTCKNKFLPSSAVTLGSCFLSISLSAWGTLLLTPTGGSRLEPLRLMGLYLKALQNTG